MKTHNTHQRYTQNGSWGTWKVENDSPFHVKDRWQFERNIREVRLSQGYKLISLDVTSLFTTTSLCTKAIKKRWQRIKPHTFITQKQFVETVNVITSESFFRFKDDYYLQKSELGMGNSISGFLADFVMKTWIHLDLIHHFINVMWTTSLWPFQMDKQRSS